MEVCLQKTKVKRYSANIVLQFSLPER